jgi:hypothetical protein
MWRLTLRNLRANLTRLVATAVAVITGTALPPSRRTTLPVFPSEVET